MFPLVFSISNVRRSSSLICLLARNHGELSAPRSFSVAPRKYGAEESYQDGSKSVDNIARRKPLDDSQTSISAVISILVQQRSKSRWTHLRSLRPNGLDPEEFSQVAIEIRNNPHLALRFFLWTQKNSLCNHNLSSYSTLIHILARGRLRHQALILIREAIRFSGSDDCESNAKPLKVFETLIKTYTQCGSAPFVFDLLIEACLQSKKIKHAIQIVRMLLSRGISPRFGTCNSLIQQVSRCLGADKGYDLYKEIFGLKNSRVRPSLEILNTLMVAFYQENMLERVKEIWNEMIESDCNPNCFSFSILIAAYCDQGKMDEAEDLWEEMRAKHVKFDVMAYNTIIGGFCQIGEVEKAEEFFKEMGLSGIESSSTTYEHLVKGYCMTGNVDSAMLVYRDMVRRGFKPDVLTIDKFIRRLCDGSRVLEALEVLRCAIGHFRLCLTRESFEVLIMGLCQRGKMEEAQKLQADMVSKGFEPSRETYGAFILGYEKQGNVEMAGKLRQEMLNFGLCA